MFLLSKLDDISRRFPEDAEGVREFLLDRGIPAGSLVALTHFSARLAIDPSFRRDVTSLVQVVIRREDEAVDYMDLLGILVVAAAGAGPIHANDEQEESVREILRFLTQVPRPTGVPGPVFVGSLDVIPLLLAAKQVGGDIASVPVPERSDLVVRPVTSVLAFGVEESKRSRWRGPAVWMAGVMVLAVALGSGWVQFHKSREKPEAIATLRVVPAPSMRATEEKDELATAPAGRVREPQSLVVRRPSRGVARHSKGLRAPLVESPITQQAPIVRSPRSLDAGQSFPPAPARPDVVADANPAMRPLNIVPESAAKTTPPVSTTTSNSPNVRRRLPKSVVINPGPLRRPGASSGSSLASGSVHPVSIGMMASNLISDPTPEYPVAATQARVQGEVTVRAVVDREGNVIDARVVSGPELLRAVSLEAVQHWRYRPYMQGGKPIEVATTAVLDFELP